MREFPISVEASPMALAAEMSSSPWSSGLTPEFAAAVLRRLQSLADQVRFAAVCRPWRAAARRQPSPPPLPWLALPDGTFFNFPGSAPLKFPHAARYYGSCDDWLIFRRGGDGGDDGYMLLNPFSGDTMSLPRLSCVRFVARDGVMLAWKGILDDWRAPSDSTVRKMAMGPGQVVAAIVGDGRVGKIVMWRPGPPGTDFWCISAHDAWRRFRDVAFYDGSVYAVESNGDLFAMASGEDTHTGGPKVAWAKRVIDGTDHGKARATRYLFLLGGRLMMARRALRSDGTAAFAVFKADLVASRWVEVTGVGDGTALFVGRWSTAARRVSRYGLPANRIHFLGDDTFCRGDDLRRFATWLFSREKETALSMSDLHADIFGQVMRHLRTRHERLSLRLVCRDWDASVRQQWRPRPPAVAYLALPDGRILRYPPDLSSRRFDYCAAACDGWLLFCEDSDGLGLLRLTSPFTGKTRLLPSLLGIHARDEPVEINGELPRAGSP
ncbi:hypothetical protein ACP70R_044057 [Stipagrostis hirtigluma subsp. patula]